MKFVIVIIDSCGIGILEVENAEIFVQISAAAIGIGLHGEPPVKDFVCSQHTALFARFQA